MTHGRTWVALLMLGLCLTGVQAQVATVRGHTEVEGGAKTARLPFPGTVVWLTPVNGIASSVGSVSVSPTTVRLTQKNKSFEPHILVIPAGSAVEFPNRDPFFHNVFSLFEGKRFDLGLYEAGSSRVVHFDRPGISFIFCNIHPEMSAVVITLATPFFAVATSDGQVNIPNVPYGRYMLNVWSEGAGPENGQLPPRDITIAENATSLGMIRVPAVSGQSLAHRNKYGREYDAPSPDNPVYHQP